MGREIQRDRKAVELSAALKRSECSVALKGVDWERARGLVKEPADLVSFAAEAKFIETPGKTLSPEVRSVYEEIKSSRINELPIELAGTFKVIPPGGKALVLVPEELREAMSELLGSFVPRSSFVCSSDLQSALKRENVSFVVGFDERYSGRTIKTLLDRESLDIPVEMVPPAPGIFGLEEMARVFEIVATFHDVKALADAGQSGMVRYPEVGIYGTTTTLLLKDKFDLLIENPFEVLSALQNRGNPLQNFSGLDFPWTRDALGLLYGRGEAGEALDPWQARSGFARSYSPQELQSLILRPGATLVSLMSSGCVLGYILGYMREEHFPDSGLSLVEALRQGERLPEGTLGYLKMVEITPAGKMFARLHGISLNDELSSLMMAYGQKLRVDSFIFECREFPFPNEGAVLSHIKHGAVHSGVSVANSRRQSDGSIEAAVAGIYTMDPERGLTAIQGRDEEKFTREEQVAARLERLQARVAARERERFFRPVEDASLSFRTLQQMKEPGVLAGLSWADFTALVGQLQQIHFNGEERGDVIPGARYYAQTGLMTPQMLDGLRGGKCLLDMGCGAAHMARFMRRAFGVKAGQVVLADRESHMRTRRSGMEFEAFELGGPWPDLARTFDYIVFEKAPVAIPGSGEASRTYRFYEDTDKVEQAFRDGTLFTIDRRSRKFFFDLIEADVPAAGRAFHVMREAFKRLNPGGEIRVSYSGLSEQAEAYVVLKLKELFPELEYECPGREGPFVLGLFPQRRRSS